MNFLSIVALTSLTYWLANSYRAGFIFCDLFLGSLVLVITFFKIKDLTALRPLSISKLKFLLLVPISLIPFLRYLPQIPFYGPISFGGYDWHAYTLMGKILQARSQGLTLPIEISDPDMVSGILEKNVFGAYWPISFISTWAQIDLPIAAVLSQWVAFLCLTVIFYQFCRLVFRYSVNLSLFLVSVFAINPYLHFLISEAYISQIWGMAFAFLFWISIFQMQSLPPGPSLARIRAYCALVGISLVYSHMLPVILASSFLLVVDELSIKSLWRSALVYLKILIRPLVISLLMTLDRQLLNIENLKIMKNVSAGPGMDSHYAEAWLGVVFDPYFNKSPVILEILATGAFLYLMWQFLNQNSSGKLKSLRWLGPGLLIGVILMVILMQLSASPAINYKTFKLISFFLPIFILVIWSQILKNAGTDPRWKIFGILLLIANVWNVGRFGQTINDQNMRTPDFSSALKELPKGPQKVTLIAERTEKYSPRDYEMMFAGVAFSDHEMSFWNSFGVFPQGPIIGDWAYLSGFGFSEGFQHYDLKSSRVCTFKLHGKLYKKSECQAFTKAPSDFTLSRTAESGEISDLITSWTPTSSH